MKVLKKYRDKIVIAVLAWVYRKVKKALEKRNADCV